MDKNIIKDKLLKGIPVCGALVSFNSPNVVEIMGAAGMDFAMLDSEHGNMNPQSLENLVRAAECYDIVPLCRVRDFERTTILKVLDIGNRGIMVPMVNTADDARRIVEWMKYAPLGKRGVAFGTRAGRYGTVPKTVHINTSNEENIAIIQLETVECVRSLEEIVEVEGVDVVFIGPSDLSQALGITGQMDNPLLKDTIEHSVKKIVAGGKIAGVMPFNADDVKRYRDMGATFFLTSAGGMIMNGVKDFVNMFRGTIGAR